MIRGLVFATSILSIGVSGLAGCGGSTTARPPESDASNADAASPAPTDATDSNDAVPSASDVSDAEIGTVAVTLDAGAFPYCYPPSGGSTDVCAVCEALDAALVVGTACSVEELRCGNGASTCLCVGGAWTCPPPCPCR